MQRKHRAYINERKEPIAQKNCGEYVEIMIGVVL